MLYNTEVHKMEGTTYNESTTSWHIKMLQFVACLVVHATNWSNGVWSLGFTIRKTSCRLSFQRKPLLTCWSFVDVLFIQ